MIIFGDCELQVVVKKLAELTGKGVTRIIGSGDSVAAITALLFRASKKPWVLMWRTKKYNSSAEKNEMGSGVHKRCFCFKW